MQIPEGNTDSGYVYYSACLSFHFFRSIYDYKSC